MKFAPLEPQNQESFASIKKKALALYWLLGIGIVLSIAAIVSGAFEARLLLKIESGGFWTDAEIDANDTRQFIVGIAQLLLFIVTGIVWLVWFSRAYKNLPALGARNLRFKPGWAIGSWFVPFLNLVRPKAMTDDTWRASDPTAPAIQEGPYKGRRVSPVLHAWWALFIISQLLGRIVFRWAMAAETIEEIRSGNIAAMLADVIDVPLTVLALLVVLQITRRQEERARVLGLTAP